MNYTFNIFSPKDFFFFKLLNYIKLTLETKYFDKMMSSYLSFQKGKCVSLIT